jgi:hypothetical protein
MVSEPRSLTRIYDSIAPFLERVVTIASPVSALLTTFIYVFQHKLNLAFFRLMDSFKPLIHYTGFVMARRWVKTLILTWV